MATVPSVWPEPLSRSMMEALACGLPVVATAVGGSPEILTGWMSSLLAQPDDADDLARPPEVLDWRDRDQISGPRCRQAAEERLSLDDEVDLIEDAMLSALDGVEVERRRCPALRGAAGRSWGTDSSRYHRLAAGLGQEVELRAFLETSPLALTLVRPRARRLGWSTSPATCCSWARSCLYSDCKDAAARPDRDRARARLPPDLSGRIRRVGERPAHPGAGGRSQAGPRRGARDADHRRARLAPRSPFPS